jgi:hypothetical protein
MLYLKKNKDDRLFNDNHIVFFLLMPYGHKHLYLPDAISRTRIFLSLDNNQGTNK